MLDGLNDRLEGVLKRHIGERFQRLSLGWMIGIDILLLALVLYLNW